MANKTQTIRIESILGGHSPSSYFSAPDQFLTSMGIDPGFGVTDIFYQSPISAPSGVIRPIRSKQISTGVVTGIPMWIQANPRTNTRYMYDYSGSVYTISSSAITGLTDLNDGGTSKGNGMAYYDNYLYFARDTTVARYGPMDGSPSFTDDYWVGTLGKTALHNSGYPTAYASSSLRYPTHVMHRHSDGKLYILDLLDNQGVIHFIKTRKTTVEGDTDDGSTYDAVNVGYGLYPICIESYGSDLVICFLETNLNVTAGSVDNTSRAKIAFWDTTSQNVNQLVWVEYPDNLITAVKNINGVLYFFSAGMINGGFRVMRYIGGNSFEEVFYSTVGSTPPVGAVDGAGERLVFGSRTRMPDNTVSGCVWQLGLRSRSLGDGIFNIASVTQSTSATSVTALRMFTQNGFNTDDMFVGWTDDAGPDVYGVDLVHGGANTYGNNPVQWCSQVYKIGQPFKITKIRIPLLYTLSSGSSLVPSVWIDGLTINDGGVENILTTINLTNYGNARSIVIRPQNLTGDTSFYLNLKWQGNTMTPVLLPITIEYEFIDVDTSHP